ncbi:nuclear transport factor 2 family protein [Glycomyces buryatensis]|uniref:Nuclear transport factor 2 family protein n=1 Tax=Glycomyces buryatensis TaxID=2570927 RepID=A0A4S8QDT9_9ACTN|nr:nuclear transport factor 2 family protein [Glycomyces buryatensis]THV42558.1 nuclear transport factor 2 family protein [Glycomyces buryatensis]
MRTFDGTDPERFIADFYISFTEELLSSDEEPAAIVDRYHTADVVEFADGHRIDRQKLIDHTRPVRKNRPTLRVEVHEAIADGDRIAARYTLHASQRGKNVSTEVYFFGRFTADGRLREANMLTRAVPTDDSTPGP